MHCTIDNCSSEASHTFVWPWGTEGACCQAHLVVVQQKARAARGRMGVVNFSALNPDRPREITRDERIELHTARLVAEGEKKDAQQRAAKLLEANGELSRERNQLRARCTQLEAQAKEMAARIADVLKERDDALVRFEEAHTELERLRLGDFAGDRDEMRTRETPPDGWQPLQQPPEAPPPTSRHVVEGDPK